MTLTRTDVDCGAGSSTSGAKLIFSVCLSKVLIGLTRVLNLK